MRTFFEIISKQDWEQKYKPEITNINQEKYASSEKMLKSLFTKMNKGTFTDTIVVDFKTEKSSDLTQQDRTFIKILKSLGYDTTKESYLAGKAVKDGKEIKILDIINAFSSKIKTKEQMKRQYEATKNENIKKQLEAIYQLDNNFFIKDEKIDISKLSIAKLNEEDKYKIVFTMDPRAIASQSTAVGWRSCMNLDTGVNRNYVKTGIEQGVFIAYLTKAGDEMELNNPTARVLIKPYKKGKAVVWKVDQIYGTAPENFRDKVQEIVNKYSSGSPGQYNLPKDVYADELPQRITHGGDAKKLMQLYKTDLNKFVGIIIDNPGELRKVEKSLTTDQKINLIKYDPNIALLMRDFNHDPELISYVLHAKPTALRFVPAEDFKLIRKDTWDFVLHNTSGGAVLGHMNENQMAAIPNNIIDKYLKLNGDIIRYLTSEQQTPKRQMIAIKDGKNWRILEHIKNPTKEVQETAVHFDPRVMEYINNPDYDVQSAAVQLDPKNARYIKNLHPELQLYLVKKNPYNLGFFNRQATPEAIELGDEMLKDMSDEERRKLIGRL